MSLVTEQNRAAQTGGAILGGALTLGSAVRIGRESRKAGRARGEGASRSRSGAVHQTLNHHASPDFWSCYRALPAEVQGLADKSFSLPEGRFAAPVAPAARNMRLFMSFRRMGWNDKRCKDRSRLRDALGEDPRFRGIGAFRCPPLR